MSEKQAEKISIDFPPADTPRDSNIVKTRDGRVISAMSMDDLRKTKRFQDALKASQ